VSYNKIKPGAHLPKEVNVIIEIPQDGGPIKYEVDKDLDALIVDRFVSTAMRYPCNYGYVPQTLSEDGDPVDVLVVTPYPIVPGAVIAARPVGMLRMSDESGPDAKIIAVPIDKLCKLYRNVKTHTDLGQPLLDAVEHFFTHYKDLEKGKWVKIEGWEDVDAAHLEIDDSVSRFHAEAVV